MDETDVKILRKLLSDARVSCTRIAPTDDSRQDQMKKVFDTITEISKRLHRSGLGGM